jgi:hypothetical protein
MSASWWRTGFAVLALASVLLVLSACGGDDDDSDTAAAPAETSTTAGNERLDAAAWDEYVALRDQARAVNQKAIATFRRCRTLLGSNVPAQQVFDCLGTAATDVVDEGREVLAYLEGLGGDVSGACAQATTTLHGNVKIYIATVNQIAISADRNELPEGQMVDSSLAQLTRTRSASSQFDTACQPA